MRGCSIYFRSVGRSVCAAVGFRCKMPRRRGIALTVVVLASILCVTAEIASFYHTSEQLLAEFRSLAATCTGVTVGCV